MEVNLIYGSSVYADDDNYMCPVYVPPFESIPPLFPHSKILETPLDKLCTIHNIISMHRK